MEPLAAFFWLCFTIVLYTYFLYPILLVILNALFRRVRGSRADAELRPLPSVTFLIPVHNEEHNLARRLDELTRMIASAGVPGEILVISDGSTDRSVEVACQFGDRGVRVIEVPSKQGKAAALNVGVAQAANNVLVFADARQRWADDALVR
jgi:biofilm PGA synthesis N-glycosyltransferase PgaC